MFERGKKEEPARQGATLKAAAATPPAAVAETGHFEAIASSRETAVIGRSIHLNGDLRGEEDLRIEGEVAGTIQLKNNSLTIGKDGRVKADVYAKVVTIDGVMEGDLFGSERVSVRKSARVLGNITAPRVSVEDGARFKGSIEMDPEAVEAALGKPQAVAKPTLAASGGAVAQKPTAVSNAKV